MLPNKIKLLIQSSFKVVYNQVQKFNSDSTFVSWLIIAVTINLNILGLAYLLGFQGGIIEAKWMKYAFYLLCLICTLIFLLKIAGNVELEEKFQVTPVQTLLTWFWILMSFIVFFFI